MNRSWSGWCAICREQKRLPVCHYEEKEGEEVKKIRVQKAKEPTEPENRGRPKKYPFSDLAPPENIQRPGGKMETQYSFFFVPHKKPSDIYPSWSYWKKTNPNEASGVKIKMWRIKADGVWGVKVVRVA